MTTFGEEDPCAITQLDILSALAFDKRGEYMSTGDYGGRCIIFKKCSDPAQKYEYLTEFVNQGQDFDSLLNQSIPSMVSQMVWLH